MKYFIPFLILLIFSKLVFPQTNRETIINSEMKSFKYKQTLGKINYPGDTSIDVKYYGLVLNIHEADRSISGNTTIGLASNTESLNSFFLDLRSTLTVDSVLSEGQRINFTHTENKLFITLLQNYNLGEKIDINVFYHGNPTASGFGSFRFGTQNNVNLIWSLSEPYGAPDWFPCKDTPGDKVDSSDVWITCNSSLKAVSNGSLVATIINGNGTTTYKWKNHYPIAHYLISVAITNYAEYMDYFHYSQTDSMPVIHYIFPGNLTDDLKKELDNTIPMLHLFSEKFGLYPFIKEKYGHAQFGWGGGMEHQTISSMGVFNEGIISHELAHQWFGDLITCRNWHHIWLNEGFATYSEGVYFEKVYGRERYDDYIKNEMINAKYAIGSIYVQDISNIGEIFNETRSYSKGGVVLHMLRGIVGDSVFYDILRAYTSDPSVAYGTVVTEDFQRIAESVYGASLDYFFNEWIYGENYPVYSVNWNTSSVDNDFYNLTVKIDQSSNSNPVYFTMPVQLNIKTLSGDTLISLYNDQQNQTFDILVKGQPIDILFDPNNWVMDDASVTTGVVEENEKISFNLQQNYPNPFNPSTIIGYQLPASLNSSQGGTLIPVNLKIYDILGNEVAILVNTKQTAGEYEVRFSPGDYGLSSGVYFYRLTAGDFMRSRKMMYIK